MKICIITNTFSPDLIGGSNIYTESISQELVNKNNEVIIIAADANKKGIVQESDNIRIYYFRPFNIATCSDVGKGNIFKQAIWTIFDIYNYYSYRKIHYILSKEKPDVVHIHTPLDITLSAFDAVKKLKLPLVLTTHDYLLLCRRVILLHNSGVICTKKNINPICKIYRNFTKKIVNSKPNMVIFPSKFISDIFEKDNFFNKSEKVILPYPVRLNNYPTYQSKGRDSNNQGKFKILYVGSLSRHKGVDVLISAFKKIHDKDNIELSIIGTGRYEEYLKTMASNDKRIIFHGKIRNNDINKFYNNADILVIPSVWNEVLGIVILEAFSAGIPAIGSRIGGIPEVIKHNYNGFLFEPGNVDQIKTTLENLINKPSALVELGKNALETAKQYGMQNHIEQLVQYYKQAMQINHSK